MVIITFQCNLIVLILYAMNQMSQLSGMKNRMMFSKMKGIPMKNKKIFKTMF